MKSTILGVIAIGALAYAAPASASSFGYTSDFQSYTVPTTGVYTITAFGAQGGSGSISRDGLGGNAGANFNLTAGQILSILVGGVGSKDRYGGGGGGGGTYVALGTTTPLVVGGGGGGGSAFSQGGAGGTSTNGSSPNGGRGGRFISAAYGDRGPAGGGGGGGFSTNGSDGSGSGGGSFLNGGFGGDGSAYGGFGGGGGSAPGIGGGGGGYGGGYGGSVSFSASDLAAKSGGGTSYINPDFLADPSSQFFQVGVNSGNGRVNITGATPIPEPSMVGGAVVTLTLGWLKRRQQRSAKTKG